MVTNNAFGFNSATRGSVPASPSVVTRIRGGISRQFSRLLCAMHGHLILLHFEPNKLSLRCALCGYESEGWEVGRPSLARLAPDTRGRGAADRHEVRPERRRALRAVPSAAAERMAS
jgi:hypothetical protein